MQDGILLVDKPAGKTSHDIVAAVRREHRGRRVGHAGTLDPFATGLLLVLVGRATRIQRHLMALPKRYETTARLGATSTTGDPEGEIVVTGMIPPDPPQLPTGDLRQRPHAYSAVKVGGRRAYEMARAGESVELAERPVTVHRFEQLWREEDRAGFAIECSAGTYVRTLIGDLGDAYCETLRRTGHRPVRRRRRRSRAGSSRSSGRWRSCRSSAWRATTRAVPATASRSRWRRRRATGRSCSSTGRGRSRSPSGETAR